MESVDLLAKQREAKLQLCGNFFIHLQTIFNQGATMIDWFIDFFKFGKQQGFCFAFRYKTGRAKEFYGD